MSQESTQNLDELRFVTRADVYKKGERAGTLQRRPDGTVHFAYVPTYTGPDIAFTLPRGGELPQAAPGALPAFFAGLLPEGHRLTLLRSALKTSFDDELSLLLAIGSDVPGDVQVVPEAVTPEEPAALARDEPSTLDFHQLTSTVDRHGLPGVQMKASASMITTPLILTRSHSILKVSPADYPCLIENENLHLQAARHLKVPVSAAEIVHDKYRVAGLLVERFDRSLSGEKRGLEDAAQVMGIPPAAKYTVAAEEVVGVLAERTKNPILAARNLYIQFVFAWLTGNGDAHAKNVSVLEGDDGLWDVAPIYDTPCTAVYGDMTTALPVNGKIKKLRLRDWDAFADAIGLRLKAARSANNLALQAASTVNLSQLPFSGSPFNACVRELTVRRAELQT